MKNALAKANKCSDGSIGEKLPALLGNYDRQTNRATEGQTGSQGSFTSENHCIMQMD